MDALTGAAMAAGVAWLSILVVALWPGRSLPSGPVRVLGGISLALLGLGVLGIPVPAVVSISFLAGGVAGVWLSHPAP